MKEIILTRNKVTLVDDEDFEYLNKWDWYAGKNKSYWYAVRTHDGNRILMHRQILKPDKGNVIDHRNGDGLDNRRNNLRECTRSQNSRNRKPNKNNISGIKGVYRYSGCISWRAYIRVDGELKFLGRYTQKRDAALAYNEAAKEFFGEYAKLNEVTL